MLAPRPPAAVVAGNVETSQHVVDALYAALGVMANSQGSMNNFTFGDEARQYYETICGGAGATARRDGASAVHTHMTNSRLTDPGDPGAALPGAASRPSASAQGSGGAGAQRGGDGARPAHALPGAHGGRPALDPPRPRAPGRGRRRARPWPADSA